MEVHKVGRTSPGGEHQVVEKAQTGTCIRFCFRDNSSVRLNSLGPLCLWQCLKYISHKVCSMVFMNEFNSCHMVQMDQQRIIPPPRYKSHIYLGPSSLLSYVVISSRNNCRSYSCFLMITSLLFELFKTCLIVSKPFEGS